MRFILAIGVAAFCFPAFAIERVNTPKTNCNAIQSIVIRDGAAILRYPSKRNPSLTLYDRYVAGSRFCKPEERAERVLVPSRDLPRCPVLQCKEYEPIFDFFFKD